jgi:hypothetical protein
MTVIAAGALFCLTKFHSTVLHLNVKKFLKYSEKWGPDARTCTQLARGLWSEELLQMIANSEK